MASAKILIVDDEIVIARELEGRLVDLGYEVTGIASSASEAIALAEQTQPQLVLMDIVLKGNGDGIEAAAEIRRRWSLPVLYITAYADQDTLQRAKITEPFGYIRLNSIVASTLHELRQAARVLQNQDLKALVIDLRGHSGTATLEHALLVGDELLDEGLI